MREKVSFKKGRVGLEEGVHTGRWRSRDTNKGWEQHGRRGDLKATCCCYSKKHKAQNRKEWILKVRPYPRGLDNLANEPGFILCAGNGHPLDL